METKELTEEEKQQAFLEGVQKLTEEFGYVFQSKLTQTDQHSYRDELVLVKINNV